MSTKGAQTREKIIGEAMRLASSGGLDGLTIGSLATEMGLSKSGLFAHFGSKEELQIRVLEAAAQRFADQVVKPAFTEARGEPRIRALFERWLGWEKDPALPGGCIFVAAAIELDDQPGPQRDYLVKTQREWLATLAKSAQMAIDAGHFRPDLDTEQFAFELYSIMLGYHHQTRLLRDPKAKLRLRTAFESMLENAHP